MILFQILFIICLAVYALAESDQYVTRKCYHVCIQGGCQYIKCQNPKCPGGACKFVDCVNPSCDGGSCVFESSLGATCNGGSCNYIKTKETLKTGYCRGGNCFLDDIPHPDLHSFISL